VNYEEFRRAPQKKHGPQESANAKLIVDIARAIRQSRQPNTEAKQLQTISSMIAETLNVLKKINPKANIIFSESACYVHQDHIRFTHLGGELVSELQQHCLLRGLGGLSVNSAVTPADVLAMINAWLSKIPEGSLKLRYRLSMAKLVEERQRLQLKSEGPIEYVPQTQVAKLLAEYSLVLPPSAQKATLLFGRLLDRIRLTLLAIAAGRNITQLISTIKRAIHDIIDEIDNDVFRCRLIAWTSLRSLEHIIVHHNASTAILVIISGRELGIEKTRLAAMAMAAALHDTIIDRNKPQGHRFWAETTHCALQDPHVSRSTLYRMIMPYEQLMLHVLDLEKLEEKPPLFESQILAMSCSIDRDMRDSYTPAYQALRTVLANKSLHHTATTALVAALGVYPRGTVLRLTDGHLSVVIDNGRHRLHRPLVRLIQRVDGAFIHEKTFVDLLDPNAPRIEGAVDERNLNTDIMQAVIEGISKEFEDLP
jgi:HD-GYP domain-containing protein (c-di-GMP phosphodiesterase class II)